MRGWIHLDVYFKDVEKTMLRMSHEAIQDKPKGSYVKLMVYLKKAVDCLLPEYIGRYFFLFEPKPHLFLALEVKDMINIEEIKRKISRVKKPDFIMSADIALNTGDGGHPDAVLDFFQTGTKYAFFRAGRAYKPGYKNQDETKLAHCFCNQLFIEPKNEIAFHKKCLKIWDAYSDAPQ